MNIGGREVGPGCPTYIVAEMGVNHQNDRNIMLRMVEEAAAAGADAVKVQNFHRECFVSASATYKGESQSDLFDRYQMSSQAVADVAERCRQVGVHFFGTPDCEAGAQELLDNGAVALKVGSDDLTNLPLIEALAKMGKPLIISTGMADRLEIEAAQRCLNGERLRQGWARFNAAGCPQYLEDGAWRFPDGMCFDEPKWSWILLHCSSLYPTPPNKANLKRLRTIGCDPYDGLAEPCCGYSDHTDGMEAVVVAVAMGACVIEKHFTLDRSMPGPDHAFSADPAQFRAMVDAIRRVEVMLGTGEVEPSDEEKAMRLVARRSIRSRFDCAPGTLLTRGHLVFQRPGDGLSPADLDKVLGKSLKVSKQAGDTIGVEDVR